MKLIKIKTINSLQSEYSIQREKCHGRYWLILNHIVEKDILIGQTTHNLRAYLKDPMRYLNV